MAEIHHLNCVKIISPVNDNVCGHCLLIREQESMALIDTGIGLLDTQNPTERIGQPLIDIVGYRFNEDQTAIKQIQKLGFDPGKVTDCIISHMDNDHIGGLADFPAATVHVAAEEYENYLSGNSRYLKTPLAHKPTIRTYKQANYHWLGFEMRKVNLSMQTEVFLVPLFGHTLGHCGVAVKAKDEWILYVGDAYYMRAELTDNSHPVNELAKMRADSNELRLASLEKIRALVNQHPEVEVFGYHDIGEFNAAAETGPGATLLAEQKL
ncbi:MAG: MBL fold metallo-hydrolase [Agriterribacter sp.]